MKLTSQLAALLLVAPLFAAACKKDAPQTLPDETLLLSPVKLLGAGEEPRTALRYDVPPETVNRAVMELKVASAATEDVDEIFGVLPGYVIHLHAGPSVKIPNGARYVFRIIKATPILQDDTPADQIADTERSVESLTAIAGRLDVSDRGIVLDSNLPWNRQQDFIHPRLITSLNNVRSAIATIPLPEEPVGVGARWVVTRQLNIWGNRVQQATTYTLLRREGDVVEVYLQIEQAGLPQTGNVNPNIEIYLSSYKMSAKGQAIVNLRELLASTKAESDAWAEFVVNKNGRRRDVQSRQRAVFQLRPVGD